MASRKKVKDLSEVKPSEVTHQALSLIQDDNSATEIDIKISKSDMIGIVSTNIVAQLEQELEVVLNSLHDIANKKANIINEVCVVELKDAQRLFGKEIEASCNISAIPTWINGKKLTRFQVNINLDLESISIQPKNMLTGERIRKSFYSSAYSYLVASSKEYQELVDQEDIIISNKLEIENRINKARDNKYITAQMNMNLLKGLRNGEQIVNNLQETIKNLSDTIFKKKELS